MNSSNNKMRTILIFSTLFVFLSCNKANNSKADDNKEYKGKVIREEARCTSPTGFGYIIYYTTENNIEDSFMTFSLPIAFTAEGTNILFKIQTSISDTESHACTTDFIPLNNLSIYEVKGQ